MKLQHNLPQKVIEVTNLSLLKMQKVMVNKQMLRRKIHRRNRSLTNSSDRRYKARIHWTNEKMMVTRSLPNLTEARKRAIEVVNKMLSRSLKKIQVRDWQVLLVSNRHVLSKAIARRLQVMDKKMKEISKWTIKV